MFDSLFFFIIILSSSMCFLVGTCIGDEVGQMDGKCIQACQIPQKNKLIKNECFCINDNGDLIKTNLVK